MTFHEKIKEEIKTAMMAKDQVKLLVLRGMSAAFTNELVAKGRKPQELLTDEESLAVVSRLAKQRKDSIDQFTKGARKDLAENEQAELAVLEVYLPKMMGKDEIIKIAEAKKIELGITDASQKGFFMKTLMQELKGKADGGDVKAVIDGLF
jgi:uncharacterized protein YqeY